MILRALGIVFGLTAALGVGPVAAQLFSPPQFVSKAAATYTGPGDLVSGAKAFWGLRAYNAAYATGSNKAINIRRASDNETCDVLINTSGNLGNTTACSGADSGEALATFCNATNCLVVSFYDQSGNGLTITDSTTSTQQQLTLNCEGTLACVTFVGSSLPLYVNASVPQPTSLTLLASLQDTSGNNGNHSVHIVTSSSGTGGVTWRFDISTLKQELLSQQVVSICTSTSTYSQGSVHNYAVSYNASSQCVFYVDAGGNTISAGAHSFSGSFSAFGNGDGDYANGKFNELIYYDGTVLTGTQITSICHNQFNYWGTATSC